MKPDVTLTIPEELAAAASTTVARDAESRMQQVIRWSHENVLRDEGPFAAAVFHLETGACLGVGVNRVLSSGCSVAHAEMMAILIAQRNTGLLDLSASGPTVLTTSAQPCSQCYGAVPWCGVTEMEFGAARDDVEAIGFDEGPCPPTWRELLEERGIRVRGPLLQAEAVAVLQQYQQRQGRIY